RGPRAEGRPKDRVGGGSQQTGAERARFLDPPLRRLLGNARWLLASDGTVLLADLAGTVLVARALGVTDYRPLSPVWTVGGVVNLLVDVRAWEAVTRYLSEFISRDQTRVALATLELAVLVEAAVAVAGFALAWAVSGVVATRLFGDPTLQAVITLGALTLVLTAFDRTARAVLRVLDRFRLLSLCSALEAVARLALIAGALAM